MIIQTLKIHNIASIEDAQIDFDQSPLADDPLFLITGETGSGKTTILNAICMALYSQVPALKSIGTAEEDRDGLQTNNPRQLLRRGTGEGGVELTFIGNDGRHYRAVWRVQRARKKITGKYQKVEWQLFIIDNGSETSFTVKREVEERIRQAVGLSFEQFTRTTLLAQGQFATFMKASDNEKSEILEKLTGTELYARIGRQVYAMAQQANEDYKALDNQIQGATLLSDDEKAELMRQLAEYEQQAKVLATQLAELEAQIAWLNEAEKLQATLSAKQAELAQAQALVASDDYRSQRDTLAQWEATADIRDILAKEQAEEKELDLLYTAVAEQAATFRGIQDGIAQLMRQQRIDEEEKAALEARFKQQAERLQQLEEELGNSDLTAMSQRVATLADSCLATQRNIDRISKWRLATSECDEAVKLLEEARSEAVNEQKRLDAQLLALPKLQLDHAAKQGYYQGQMQLNDHIRELRQRFTQQQVCPLCGNTQATLYTDEQLAAHLTTAKAAYEQAAAALGEANSTIAKAKAALAMLAATVKSRQAQAAKRQELKDKAEQEARLCEDYDRPDVLTRLQASLAALKQQLQAEQDALAAATARQKALDIARKEVESLRSANDESARKLALQAQANTQLTQQAASIAKLFDSLAHASHQASHSTLLRAPLVAPANSQLSTLNSQLSTLNSQLSTLSTTLNNLHGRIDLTVKRKAILHQTAADYFAVNTLYTLERITQLTAIPRDAIAAYKAHVEAADRQLSIANTVVQTINEQLAAHLATKHPDWPLPTTPHSTLPTPHTSEAVIAQQTLNSQFSSELCSFERQRETLNSQLSTLNSQLISIRTRLDCDAQLAATIGKKRQQLEQLRQAKDNWDLLDRSFGGADGKKFRNIAQSHVLRTLLNKANQYLMQLSNRYQLDCDEGSLTINVIDRHHGDAVRNVGLLSGGESFIVSLALALGLSSISSAQLNVDTLFIDEGFGTLSSDHLETVINTLDRLHQNSARRVGIISHVEGLKERIPTQITLQRTGPSSSTIKVTTL